MDIQLVKESYYHELQRKNEINSGLAIPIGALTGTLISIYILLKEYAFTVTTHSIAGRDFLFLLFLALSGLSTLLAAGFISRAGFGHRYRYYPMSKEIIDQYKIFKPSYLKFYKLGPDKSQDASDAFQMKLAEKFAESIIFNFQQNNKKAAFISIGFQFILGGIGNLLVAFLFFAYAYIVKLVS